MKSYSTIKEVIEMLKEMSGGQKDIIEFEQQNQYWVFTLSGSPVMGGGVNVGIKVKVLAL